MCGFVGAWAPPTQDASALGPLGALAGLRLSHHLHALSDEVMRDQRRLVARWAWQERRARWGEVTDALGPSVSHALQALQHRGPDGVGFYLSPHKRLWFAHARLAVRGVEGAQPIGLDPERSVWSLSQTNGLSLDRAESSLWAVVNGELYDQEEGELQGLSDSTRLLTRYQAEGVVSAEPSQGEAHRGLRGEYAFALWDERSARLWLGRDPFGVKPLVYAWRAGRLYFASEAKALFALGLEGLEPQWELMALQRALLYQYVPPQWSYFKGISPLIPGGSLVVTDEGVQLDQAPLDQLYAPSAHASHASHIRLIDEQDRVATLRASLLEATALRLESEAPLCFQLSGGLDSSAILGAARQLGAQDLKAFTIAFDDPRYNEAPQAQHTASWLGARCHVVDASRSRLLEALSDAVFYAEGPCINGQLPAKRLLCQAMREAGVSVCLSGEGADEALLGYPHLMYDAQHLTESAHSEAPSGAHSGAHSGAQERLWRHQPQTAAVMMSEGASPIMALSERWGYTPHFLSAKHALLSPLRALFEPERFGGAMSLSAQAAPWHTLPDELGLSAFHPTSVGQELGLQRAQRSMWAWARLCLTGYILRGIGDGMEMSSSIEGRPVYLDPRLFRCAHQHTLRGGALKVGQEKALLREAVRGWLPEAARLAPKRSLVSPPLSQPHQGGVTLLSQALDVSASSWALIPGLSPTRVERWLHQLTRLEATALAQQDLSLMTLMSLYELQRRFQLTCAS